MKGQKGIRILCFDGGGTRGVLTLALLKHVEKVTWARDRGGTSIERGGIERKVVGRDERKASGLLGLACLCFVGMGMGWVCS